MKDLIMKKLLACLLVVLLFIVMSCSKDETNELEGTTWRLIIEPPDVYKTAFMHFSSTEMRYYYSYDSVSYYHLTLKYLVQDDSLITTAQTVDGPIKESYFYNVSGDTLKVQWDEQTSSYVPYDIDLSALPEAVD